MQKEPAERNRAEKKGMSIRVQFTLIIIGVLTFVIVALCLINATYLERYATSRKQKQILEAVGTIGNCVETDFDDDTVVELDRVVKNGNMDILVVKNAQWVPQIVYASDLNQQINVGQLLSYLYGNMPDLTDVDIYEETDDYIVYKGFDTHLGGYQMTCIGHLDDVGYIMTTPLESLRESARLSNQFLIYIGIAAVLLGALLVYLVTGRLTKPVKELSQISRQMAELNFDARYTGKQKNEIGVLGQNMNYMSESLHRVIDELRSANAQLEKDLEEKDRIDEMRRVFLSNVSHELKTPIALIQGYAEGLRDGITDDPENMEFYCDVIVDEAQKMNQIVRRLLNLDEIESGEMQLVREMFNLSEMIRGVLQSTKMMAEECGCEMVVQVEPEIYVYADEFMIEEVFQNYMTNAYHYVSRPGVITVSTVLEENRVVVSVHDTGTPIPEEDLEQIWDKFYKVDKARTRSYGGSGIGLSIVKAIIHNHHSRCGVINRDGGVDFWFELERLSEEERKRLEEQEEET